MAQRKNLRKKLTLLKDLRNLKKIIRVGLI